MSRRVFYIVHLDKGRIFGLALFGTGMLLTAFATGYRISGHTEMPPVPSPDLQDQAIRLTGPTAEEEKVPQISLNDPDRSEREGKQPERVNLLDSALDEKKSGESPEKRNRVERDDMSSRVEKRREEKKTTVKKERPKPEPRRKEKSRPDVKPIRTENAKKTAPEAPGEKISPQPEKQNVYVLQMGAYQSREAALRLSAQIRKHGINTYVRKTGNIHAVRTDGTSNRDELFQVEKKLKSLHFSPITVMIRAGK